MQAGRIAIRVGVQSVGRHGGSEKKRGKQWDGLLLTYFPLVVRFILPTSRASSDLLVSCLRCRGLCSARGLFFFLALSALSGLGSSVGEGRGGGREMSDHGVCLGRVHEIGIHDVERKREILGYG